MLESERVLDAQGNGVVKEGAEERMQSAQQAFEEAGQLVVDADQAQEEAAAARQEADRLSRLPQPSTCVSQSGLWQEHGSPLDSTLPCQQ